MNVELRLNGGREVHPAAGALVRELANSVGLRPEKATRLRVVVEELVREAAERPRVGEGDDVVVSTRTESGRLVVEVADLALPVTPGEARRASSRRLAALGFVDQLHLRCAGRAGNVARCSVRLEPAAADLAGETVLSDDAPAVSQDQADALTVRAMEPGDAMGLVRCVYRCYGYTYKDPHLYEPRHIAHALRSGEMHSAVAVAPDRTVVGHCAIFVQRAGDPVPEAGRMVVDPRYRGHHLAERLAAERMSMIEGLGIPGFWAEAVTNHPASQREVLKLGGTEVGLLIGASPAAVAMEGFENINHGRRTLLATYTPLIRAAGALNVPERHAAFISEIAGQLGIERTIATEFSSPTGETEISSTVASETGLAHIRAERIGPGFAARVADEIEGLDAFDLGAIHLDLPLSDPAAASEVEELEALGFCFAAWIPNFLPSGDALRLQRVGSHPVEAEHVVCARPEGEQVRDYVLSEWHRVRRGGIEAQ